MTAPSLEVHISPDDLQRSLREDALRGLTATPKWLPPKWFYDATGSELFEKITVLDEYYPTRTERALIAAHAADIAAAAGTEILVELGSGSSEKTRLLLRAASDAGTLRRYVPQDVSPSALTGAIAELEVDFPGLDVHGIVSDFTDTLRNLPGGGRRTIAFLGGTLGNLVPVERAEFLAEIARTLESGEHLLLGVGLVVDPSIVVPAYDDAAGVTAQFNLNVLRVLNNSLGSDFDVDAFEHVAVWDGTNEWIEMRLRSTREQTVHLPGIDTTVSFAENEEMRTEISAKFRRDNITAELGEAGFGVDHFWTDEDDRFALILAQRRS